MVSADDIAKFIALAIIIALSILFVFFVSGRYINLKIDQEKYERYGKAVTLLHAIATSSELVYKTPEGQPLKSILDKKIVSNLDNMNKELNCCNYYDYDYNLKIEDFRTSQSWNIGFNENEMDAFFNKGIECNFIQDRHMPIYSLPVTIKDGDDINPGIMKLKLVKTPLSNIAYFASVACMKENFEQDFKVYNLIDGTAAIRITKLDSESYEICVTSITGVKTCKKIFCSLNIEKRYFSNDECNDLGCSDECKPVRVKREGEMIVIYVPTNF